jgi:hypothetical protein
MQRFRSRQITMVSLGVIGTGNSLQILVQGLDDKYLNVRLATDNLLKAQLVLAEKLQNGEEINICNLIIGGLGSILG